VKCGKDVRRADPDSEKLRLKNSALHPNTRFRWTINLLLMPATFWGPHGPLRVPDPTVMPLDSQYAAILMTSPPRKCLSLVVRGDVLLDEPLPGCPSCGELRDVVLRWDAFPCRITAAFEAAGAGGMSRWISGVWRFGKLLAVRSGKQEIVTIGEGQTIRRTPPPSPRTRA